MPNAISTSHEPHHAVFFEEARFLLESCIPAPNFIVARAMSVVTSTLSQNTENDKSGCQALSKMVTDLGSSIRLATAASRAVFGAISEILSTGIDTCPLACIVTCARMS